MQASVITIMFLKCGFRGFFVDPFGRKRPMLDDVMIFIVATLAGIVAIFIIIFVGSVVIRGRRKYAVSKHLREEKRMREIRLEMAFKRNDEYFASRDVNNDDVTLPRTTSASSSTSETTVTSSTLALTPATRPVTLP